jgi:hypothetical protein
MWQSLLLLTPLSLLISCKLSWPIICLKILYRDGGTCWEITDSATQFQLSLLISDFTVGITPMPSSNSRTVDSRSLELSTLDLSISRMLFLIARLSGSRSLGLAPNPYLSVQHSRLISSGSNISDSRTVGPKVALRRTQ